MVWTGRELTSHDGNTHTYDSNDLRTSKTLETGEKTEYYYSGSTLMFEHREITYNGQPDGMSLFYTYNAGGQLSNIRYIIDSIGYEHNYYPVCNSRGDVETIYDYYGNLMVKYTYDAWGQLLSISDENGSYVYDEMHIGVLNPFRYRGYYFDNETSIYYLKSRYYVPFLKRFINADGYVQTGQGLNSMNMYTYCGNNPVNRADPSGMFWKKIVNTVKNIVLKVVNVITSSATKLITTIIDTKYEKNITNKIDEFGPVGNVANKMNDYSNMQKDKTTHTKNVIGIGTQGSTYKVEPFINKKLIINEQKYIEQCANIFSNVELLAMTTMSIDVHSLQKGDIERMSQNILSWDASMNDRFIDVYYKELIKDGLNDVYSP